MGSKFCTTNAVLSKETDCSGSVVVLGKGTLKFDDLSLASGKVNVDLENTYTEVAMRNTILYELGETDKMDALVLVGEFDNTANFDKLTCYRSQQHGLLLKNSNANVDDILSYNPTKSCLKIDGLVNTGGKVKNATLCMNNTSTHG